MNEWWFLVNHVYIGTIIITQLNDLSKHHLSQRAKARKVTLSCLRKLSWNFKVWRDYQVHEIIMTYKFCVKIYTGGWSLWRLQDNILYYKRKSENLTVATCRSKVAEQKNVFRILFLTHILADCLCEDPRPLGLFCRQFLRGIDYIFFVIILNFCFNY